MIQRNGVLCLAVLSALACGPGDETQPASGQDGDAPLSGSLDERSERGLRVGRTAGLPDVYLITVDTLRRGHLGCYGYANGTSPNIDALARESVVFDRALATTGTTVPSHLSIMTGLYAHQHGRLSNMDGVESPFVSTEGAVSLAASMAARGYATAAFVSSLVLHERTGLSDGFEHYASPGFEERNVDASVTTERAVDWLQGRDDERPLFLWVHYWDPHEPNDPPSEYASQMPLASPEWMASQSILPIDAFERRGQDPLAWKNFFLRKKAPDKKQQERMDKDALVADLVRRYDGDILFLDENVGRLLRSLPLADSMLVFTADHGQSLGELGALGHGRVSTVNTSIPLIVHLPDSLAVEPFRETQTRASLIDIAPTVLGRLPLLPTRDGFGGSGEDLFSGRFARKYAFAQEASGASTTEGVVCTLETGPWKYVYRSRGQDHLYDLEGMGERLNVLDRHPSVATQLADMVERLLQQETRTGTGTAASEEAQRELLENLKALGYTSD